VRFINESPNGDFILTVDGFFSYVGQKVNTDLMSLFCKFGNNPLNTTQCKNVENGIYEIIDNDYIIVEKCEILFS
jgi:hypothetical protein